MTDDDYYERARLHAYATAGVLLTWILHYLYLWTSH